MISFEICTRVGFRNELMRLIQDRKQFFEYRQTILADFSNQLISPPPLLTLNRRERTQLQLQQAKVQQLLLLLLLSAFSFPASPRTFSAVYYGVGGCMCVLCVGVCLYMCVCVCRGGKGCGCVYRCVSVGVIRIVYPWWENAIV